MSRSVEERIADVRRVLDAAKTLVASRRGIVSEISESTGLSPEGVEHALLHHLEIDVDPADLHRLVAAAGDVPHVHVILSANVFVAALRAIALARAAAPSVTVRPSSRDPVFSRALIAALADPAVRIWDSADFPEVAGLEIHVYGRDETIAAVRAAARGAVVRGHGAGIGVACTWDHFERDAERLADDVIAFDQRGCLSPRIAFVVGDSMQAQSFAENVHASLAARERTIPRGALSESEIAEARRYAETLRFAGIVYQGDAHLVGVANGIVLPPPGRHLHIVPVASREDAVSAIQPLEKAIVAIGLTDPALHLPWPAHARRSAIGAMQRPPLDGPVDLRSK